MPGTCQICDCELPEIDTAVAGSLARRVAASLFLVCDDCANAGVEDETGSRERSRLANSGIPVALAAASFEEIGDEHKSAAIEAVRNWADGTLPLLTLFGNGAQMPDRLAATAALKRLQQIPVRWVSASEPDLRQRAGGNAALVLADVEQGGLLRTSLAEMFEIVAMRQRRQIPLLVTANVRLSELAKRTGEPFVQLLRRGKVLDIAKESER